MAITSLRQVPSSSSSAGTTPSGLTFLNAPPNCSPLRDAMTGHLLGTVERVVRHHQTAIVLIGVTGGSVAIDNGTLVYWKKSYFGEMVPVEPHITGQW